MSQRREIAGWVCVALLMLGLANAIPASAAMTQPAAQAASLAAPSLPWNHPPTFLDTFTCYCEATDPCTGSGYTASRTCQAGQQCRCLPITIDYQDGHSCVVGVGAHCVG